MWWVIGDFISVSFNILRFGEFAQIDSVFVRSLHILLIFISIFVFLHFKNVHMCLIVPLCTNNFRKSTCLWFRFSVSLKPDGRHFTSIFLILQFTWYIFLSFSFQILMNTKRNHHVSNYYIHWISTDDGNKISICHISYAECEWKSFVNNNDSKKKIAFQNVIQVIFVWNIIQFLDMQFARVDFRDFSSMSKENFISFDAQFTIIPNECSLFISLWNVT